MPAACGSAALGAALYYSPSYCYCHVFHPYPAFFKCSLHSPPNDGDVQPQVYLGEIHQRAIFSTTLHSPVRHQLDASSKIQVAFLTTQKLVKQGVQCTIQDQKALQALVARRQQFMLISV